MARLKLSIHASALINIIYCISHQGHDKQELHINDWVAVAYDSKHSVGQILSINNKDAIKVNLLAQKKDDTFRRPKQRDSNIVSDK